MVIMRGHISEAIQFHVSVFLAFSSSVNLAHLVVVLSKATFLVVYKCFSFRRLGHHGYLSHTSRSYLLLEKFTIIPLGFIRNFFYNLTELIMVLLAT